MIGHPVFVEQTDRSGIHDIISHTLESEINVRVRLLILKDFPTRTALISDRMFIEYDPKLEI